MKKMNKVSTDIIDLEVVWKKIMAHVGDFPQEKLRNRLLNLGFEEFVGKGGISDSSAVLEYGFPFKFNNQLDEGILVLAHFLDRFKREGGDLEIYAINKLSKGQEKDLSFWHDAKARLYLELQNIILLLDETEFTGTEPDESGKFPLRRSRIRRIFTFGELADLAFLSQSGINVLGEQIAAKIDIGFLFLKTFAGTKKIKPLTNTLIINYQPETPTPARHNFFELYGFTDDPVRYDLPYKERCSARWFTKAERKFALEHEARLNEIVSLFTDDVDKFSEEPKSWEDLGVNSRTVSRFEQSSAEFFNDAMLMMYKAYGSEIGKDINNGQFIINRINGAVITRDMIRLQRAMSSFGNAIEIRAVDATSTKNSLNVHESSPVYRDWLRRSLNRVLRSSDKTLHRIYILDDDVKDEDRDIEYQTLLRLIQFYRDYFHYEVSEMKEIVERHSAPEKPSIHSDNYGKWFEARWKTFENRVEVHVTTSTVITAFVEDALKANEYSTVLERIFRNHTEKQKNKKPHVYRRKDIAKLDYLYARYEIKPPNAVGRVKSREERMIYNFLNPRADTGELSFPAFTYRDTFSTEDEWTRIFDFTENHALGALESTQEQHRVNLLAISLLQYADTYKDILKELLEDDNKPFGSLVATLQEERKEEGDVTVVTLDAILDARSAFEKRLYDYFKPLFDYLNAVLEFMSVKVGFWEDIDASSSRDIFPFRECSSDSGAGQDRVKPFTDFLMAKVQARLDEHPEEIPKPEDYGLTSRTAFGGGVTEDKAYQYDVFISYRWRPQIEDWVRNDLYERLIETGLKVLLDKRGEGFDGGKSSLEEMQRGPEQSRHTLGIITPEYFEAGSSTVFEANMAQLRDISGKTAPFIPFILRQTELPLRVSVLTFFDWTDPQNHVSEWARLLNQLKAPNLEIPPPGPFEI